MDAGQESTTQLTATGSSGDWLPSDELQSSAVAALSGNLDVHVFLESVDHLDASALQLLLALAAELRKGGRRLELVRPSGALERWFHYAGASALLQKTGEARASAKVAQQ